LIFAKQFNKGSLTKALGIYTKCGWLGLAPFVATLVDPAAPGLKVGLNGLIPMGRMKL
jgi:hypothetical protein